MRPPIKDKGTRGPLYATNENPLGCDIEVEVRPPGGPPINPQTGH
jgi:hypothetical protein